MKKIPDEKITDCGIFFLQKLHDNEKTILTKNIQFPRILFHAVINFRIYCSTCDRFVVVR